MAEIQFNPNSSMLHDKYTRMIAPSQEEDYLWVGKPPKIGQRAEIRLAFPPSQDSSDFPLPPPSSRRTSSSSLVSMSSFSTSNSSLRDSRLRCRLSGIVTRVGDLISPDVFDGMVSSTILKRYNGNIKKLSKHLNRDNICSMKSVAKKELRRVIEQDGTLHGQRIVVYAVLCPEFWEKTNTRVSRNIEPQLPVRKDRVYRILLKAEEHLRCHWSVEQVLDVMDKYHAVYGNDHRLLNGRPQAPTPVPTVISAAAINGKLSPRSRIVSLGRQQLSPVSATNQARAGGAHKIWKKVPSVFRKWLLKNPLYLDDEDDDESLSFTSEDEESFCLFIVEWDKQQGMNQTLLTTY